MSTDKNIARSFISIAMEEELRAEITKLRAERDAAARERYQLIADLADMKARAMRGDAAARDMRERCAKEAETAGCGDPKCMGCYGNQIAATIRALPLAVVATEGKT